MSSQLRHVSTTGKKPVKRQYLLQMSSQYAELNFGPLTAEICWRVWGIPANFNGFRVLAWLLHRRGSTDVNQILDDVWPSPALIYYIYIFGGSCPQRNFARCKIYFASKSCVLLYWQHYCAALEHWASAKLCGVQQRVPPIFAGRPSRWASAHILIYLYIYCLKLRVDSDMNMCIVITISSPVCKVLCVYCRCQLKNV